MVALVCIFLGRKLCATRLCMKFPRKESGGRVQKASEGCMKFPRKEKTAAEEIVYVAFSSDVQGETADGGGLKRPSRE